MIYSQISYNKIETQLLINMVESSNYGAINIFIGSVRNTSSSNALQEIQQQDSTNIQSNKSTIRQVKQIEYSAYLPMAEQELKNILHETKNKYKAISMAAEHRLGLLNLSEIAVAIVVATPHRDAAFQACRFIIEEIKKRVPIWKKEIYYDNSFTIYNNP